MEFLGKSVQCIEIAEKVESVMMYNCQVTFLLHSSTISSSPSLSK